MWLADRGFWLSIVEFQPSGFGKGSYLNVSAHWFWSAVPGSLSFDYCLKRQKPWIAFRDAAEFKVLADRLAKQAAEESEELRTRIPNIRAVGALLVAEERAWQNEDRGGGWPAFHAAVASGLSGDMATARTLFDSAYTTLGSWRPDLQALLAPYANALKNGPAFRKFIAQTIDRQRPAFGLGPWLPSPA